MHRQESVVRGIYVISICVTSLSEEDPKGIRCQVHQGTNIHHVVTGRHLGRGRRVPSRAWGQKET